MRTLGRERFYGKRPLPSKIGSEEPIFATFPRGEGFGAAFAALGGRRPPHFPNLNNNLSYQQIDPRAWPGGRLHLIWLWVKCGFE